VSTPFSIALFGFVGIVFWTVTAARRTADAFNTFFLLFDYKSNSKSDYNNANCNYNKIFHIQYLF